MYTILINYWAFKCIDAKVLHMGEKLKKTLSNIMCKVHISINQLSVDL